MILNINNKSCLCLTNKNNNNIYASYGDFYTMNESLIDKYDSLKNKFEEYKLKNNGIFTFELFKEVLSILTIELEGEEKQKNKKIFTNGLFLLFSYPNNYIDKTTFCSFIQITKNDFSLNSINNILNKYEIPKKINIEKFGEIIDYLIIEL